MEQKKNFFTKEEITAMADRCYRRCWHCDRYEPHSGSSCGGGAILFYYSSSGCYEAHDLPWESGHWCPFWGNKHHPDSGILRSLTWDNVLQSVSVERFYNEPSIRKQILERNPEIAEQVRYCDNSNESRVQYFNKSENWFMFKFQNVYVYCETLRRYRFSLVDNRLLYPGANEWIRPMILVLQRKSYKILESCVSDGDGIQISFACSPSQNYILEPDMFRFDEKSKVIICEFRSRGEVIGSCSLPISSYV